MVVFGLLSRPGVCPGSANGSRLVLGSRAEEEVGMREGRETGGPMSVTPGVAGSAGGSAEQQGKWEHLCRSVAARQA